MFNTKLVLFLLLVSYNSNNGEAKRYASRHRSRLGNDERPRISKQSETYLLEKIRLHVANKNILEILNNSDTSIQNKMGVIDFYLKYQNFSTSCSNTVKAFDLTAGNLFRDFNNNDDFAEVF
jgi:hypothetical protein